MLLWLTRHLWLVALSLALAKPTGAEDLLTPAQLREDLRVLAETIERSHPNVNHSVPAAELKETLTALEKEFREPLTRDQAWLRFASLNPLLSDGHFFIGMDWRGATKAHLAQGGGFFPYEVEIDADSGALLIAAELGGKATPMSGARITRINGADSTAIVRRLLALTHGDSPAFRARLLARRWFFYYWKAYGAPERFELSVERNGTTQAVVPAVRRLPALLVEEESFEKTYCFELLPYRAAVLTLGSFAWPDPDRYFAFTEDAFTKMRDKGVRTLIIDVRNNGGGDDELWMRGVLRYIADKPYRWGSTYRKRVVEAYRDEGETVGTVVTGSIDRWIEPEPDHPLHFDGQVYVLVGPATYSSAVLFSNVMQDFGFGTVAGTRGSVRSRQSGGVQQTKLPHSALVLWWPRFVLLRLA